MKRIVLALFLVLFTAEGAFAQKKGETTFGVNMAYGIKVPNVGMELEMHYGILDDIRLEASFDYLFRNKAINMWDLNLNAHYVIPVSKHVGLYPLVGFAYTNWGVKANWSVEDKEIADKIEDMGLLTEGKVSGHTGKIGANLGVGADYNLSEKLALNLEAKYQLLSDLSQVVFSCGVTYKFLLW